MSNKGDPSYYHPKDVGRPSKLTPKTRSIILEYIELGMSLTRAGRLAGVDPHTIGEWLKRGEEERHGIYYKFSKEFAQAKEKLVETNLKLVRASAQGKYKTHETKTVTTPDGQITVTNIDKTIAPNERSAQWLLERICPQSFSQRQIISDDTADHLAEDLNDIINGGNSNG